MLTDPAIWGPILIAASVLFAGGRIIARIDAASVNLGNGSNGIHSMVYDRLAALEEELNGISAGVEGLDYILQKIDDSVRPESEVNPFALQDGADNHSS